MRTAASQREPGFQIGQNRAFDDIPPDGKEPAAADQVTIPRFLLHFCQHPPPVAGASPI
jgi:hypothetical protein